MSVAVVGLTSRLGRLAWGMVRRQKCQALPNRESGGRPLNLFWMRSPRSYTCILTPLDVSCMNPMLFDCSFYVQLARHSLPPGPRACTMVFVWESLGFCVEKAKGNKKQGDPRRKFVMPLFRMLRWISRRSSHRVRPSQTVCGSLAQHARSAVLYCSCRSLAQRPIYSLASCVISF